jgi:hypothetical protein
MAKNQMVVPGGKKQFVDIATLLANKADRAKLQNYIDEVVRCKTKILDQNESIKTLRDAAVEELGIQPKMFSSLVSLFFNNNFEEKLDELTRLENAITALMQTGPVLSMNNQKADNEEE